MKRTAAKIVPKLLNFEQKQHHMDIVQEMLTTFNDDPDMLKNGVMTLKPKHDIEIKAQSSQWKRPEAQRPKKALQVRSNVKILLPVFFDYNGVVHHEFLPQGCTVNKEYYLEVMPRLREAIR